MEQFCKMKLTYIEVLALCKILLDSGAFTKQDMAVMLNELISCCVPKNNQKLVMDLVSNETFHYVELRHKTKFDDTMWEIGQAIHNCHYIGIKYSKIKDNAMVTRKVKPVAIMFSEYYF